MQHPGLHSLNWQCFLPDQSNNEQQYIQNLIAHELFYIFIVKKITVVYYYELLFIIFVSNISSYTLSPRNSTPRKIASLPAIKGLKPFGGELHGKSKEVIKLLIEEYEALRLCDYEQKNHERAAELMGISRPTFTRIYASALRKIASSFVEGHKIIIEGGQVYFDSDWIVCKDCESTFSNPHKESSDNKCPLCGSVNISPVTDESGNGETVKFRCNRCDISHTVNADKAGEEQFCKECNEPMQAIWDKNCGINGCL